MDFLKIKRKGALALNAAVITLITAALLSITINVFSVVNRINVQNGILYDITRYIELRGCVDNAVYTEFNRLIDSTNLTDCSFSVTSENGKIEKIQFGDGFNVYIHSKFKIGLGGLVSIPLNLKQVAFGRSERYWK